MDRNAAPWRVLEAPVAGDEPPDATSRIPVAPDLAGIPVPWVVGGAIAVMVALAIAGVLLAGAGGPHVAVPAFLDGTAVGSPGRSEPVGSGVQAGQQRPESRSLSRSPAPFFTQGSIASDRAHASRTPWPPPADTGRESTRRERQPC